MNPPATPSSAILTAADAAVLLEPLLVGGGPPTIAVLHLDADRRLLGTGQYTVAEGDARLPTRAILSDGLRLGAEGMILAHRRRDGDPAPSVEERQATRDLAEDGRRLGIDLHDRLVFADGGCESFRRRGLL